MKNQIITLSLIASSAVFAANLPTSGDIQRQVQQPKIEEIQKALPTISKEYKAPMAATDTVTTRITGFTFSGNTVFDSNTLAELISPYVGKELGMNGLKEVASVITKYYRDHGYFVARAYLPEQKIKDGRVEIAIIEGAYGGFEVKNSSLVNTNEIQNYMDYLKQGQIVSTYSLERQMLLINDLSGVQVTNAEVYPGKAVGTSEFAITTAPTSKYNGYGVMDNYGSVYTGEYRLSAGAYINSLSGVGDTLLFSGMISNTANLKNVGVNYQRPLGYTGLKGSLSASTTRYTLDHISNYDGYGTANSFGANLTYPLIKTRSHTQNISLSYAHRDMKDFAGIPGSVEKSEKSIDAATLRLDDKRNTNLLNHPGKLYSAISVTAGNAGMDNEVAQTNDVLMNTDGSYKKANLDISHTQQINPVLSVQTSFTAQKSFGKNLDSSEDISVGGSNGVRAYEDSELSGDEGFVLSLEMIYALPKIETINHYGSLFVDHARIWKNTDVFNSEENIRNLSAIGLGYTLNYKNIDLKMSYADGIGSERTPTMESEFSTNSNKVLVQGLMRF